MGTKEAKDLYLRVTESREYGYFHIVVSVCVQRYEQGAGQLPAGVDDTYESGPKLSNLRIRCQGDDSSQRRTDAETVYGYEPIFMDVQPNLDECRRMMKALEMIERGLRKLEETRGGAKTFAEYIGRVGEVLKVKGMCHQRSASQRRYDDREWEWTNLGEGVRAIHNRIWRWQQEAVRAEPAPASETEVAS